MINLKTVKETLIALVVWLCIVATIIYTTSVISTYIHKSNTEVAPPDGTKVENVQQLQN